MCMARLELATNPIPISIVAVKGFYKSHYLFLSDDLPTELYSLHSVFPECHKNVTMIDVKTVTNCNVDIQSLLKGTNTPISNFAKTFMPQMLSALASLKC